MEVEKKKRKRIKGKKMGSSGPVKTYPLLEEILSVPLDDRAGVIYKVKK